MRPTMAGYFVSFIRHFFHLRPGHTCFTLLCRFILYSFSPYPESAFESYFLHFGENKRVVFFQTVIEGITDGTLLVIFIIRYIYFRIMMTYIRRQFRHNFGNCFHRNLSYHLSTINIQMGVINLPFRTEIIFPGWHPHEKAS